MAPVHRPTTAVGLAGTQPGKVTSSWAWTAGPVELGLVFPFSCVLPPNYSHHSWWLLNTDQLLQWVLQGHSLVRSPPVECGQLDLLSLAWCVPTSVSSHLTTPSHCCSIFQSCSSNWRKWVIKLCAMLRMFHLMNCLSHRSQANHSTSPHKAPKRR